MNAYNDTALTLAIYKQYPKKAILALIEAMTTEQLNHVTKNGDSALRIALSTNADPEIITALAKKCDVNLSLNDNNSTALTLAIFNKYPIDGILALIEAMKPEELNHVTKNGHSSLGLALKRLPVDKLVRFLFAYSKKQEDKLKTASLSIFTAFTIPIIIHGLKTVKKRLDIQRIEALYNQYLQIDDAEQKKEKLTQLLKTITDKKMEPLGELARLIKLQLALLKDEDLSNQDIQDYFENTHFLGSVVTRYWPKSKYIEHEQLRQKTLYFWRNELQCLSIASDAETHFQQDVSVYTDIYHTHADPFCFSWAG